MRGPRLATEPEGSDDYYPGPLWEPVIYDGSFPQIHEPGDIYINRYRNPPLIYIFTHRGNCEQVTAEEVKEWIRLGWMKRPIPVPSSKTKSLSIQASPTATPPSSRLPKLLGE